MSDIFPKWTNRLPLQIAVGTVLVGTAVTAGVWYYFTPKYTRVGYQPIQPVAFSHAIHADQLGLDCRYCHSAVEKSWYSNVPSASTCMNCHSQVLKDSPKLELVRESAATGKPIPWVHIHKTPDYVYFNHSVHVNRGVSCVHCHGQIGQRAQHGHATKGRERRQPDGDDAEELDPHLRRIGRRRPGLDRAGVQMVSRY